MRDAVGERYRVDREIARGGAARVFLAYDADGDRVALKVLRPELAVSVTADRFLREISLLRRMQHSNIAQLLDYGESEFVIYYVMSYVLGSNLYAHLQRARRVSVNDTRRIALDLLDALDYAHREGIVHRDVKPENVIVAATGPVLVDFGIARAIAEAGTDRLTRSGFAVGTSTYMSPEQAQGLPDIDHRSDLYSLACVLFECLAGRPPFVAPREDQVLRMHLQSRAPDIRRLAPGTPDSLATAVMRALTPNREKRWQSAQQMRRALSLEALG